MACIVTENIRESRDELALIVAVVITGAAFLACVLGVIDVVWQIGLTILAVVMQRVIRSADRS